MKSQWSLVHEPVMFKHEEGCFIVKLGSKEDRFLIVYVVPYLFFGKPMIIKQWSVKFDFHKEVPSVVLIWVKLPNLPLNRRSPNSPRRLGSLVGVPIYAD